MRSPLDELRDRRDRARAPRVVLWGGRAQDLQAGSRADLERAAVLAAALRIRFRIDDRLTPAMRRMAQQGLTLGQAARNLQRVLELQANASKRAAAARARARARRLPR